MLSEARRALFNRESVVEIFVNSLILNDAGSTVPVATTGARDGKAAAAAGASTPAGEGATLVGVVRGRSRCPWGGGEEGAVL